LGEQKLKNTTMKGVVSDKHEEQIKLLYPHDSMIETRVSMLQFILVLKAFHNMLREGKPNN